MSGKIQCLVLRQAGGSKKRSELARIEDFIAQREGTIFSIKFVLPYKLVHERVSREIQDGCDDDVHLSPG